MIKISYILNSLNKIETKAIMKNCELSRILHNIIILKSKLNNVKEFKDMKIFFSR
jgi:hypothetical protein